MHKWLDLVREHATTQHTARPTTRSTSLSASPAQSVKPTPQPTPQPVKRKRRASSPDTTRLELIKRFKTAQASPSPPKPSQSAAKPTAKPSPKPTSPPKPAPKPNSLQQAAKPTEKTAKKGKRMITGIKPLIASRSLLEGPAWDRCVDWQRRLTELVQAVQ